MFSYKIPHLCGIYYIPQPSTNAPSPSPSWLPQISLSTLSKIYDTASRTTLTQSFLNPSSNSPIAKARYTFPLYESCAVTSSRCYIGTRVVSGIVKEKETAQDLYNAAIERGETAGLLEQHRPDVFSTSLGNIAAGEIVRVEIEYIGELRHDAGVDGVRFTIPTSIAPRYGDAPTGILNTLVEGGMKITVQMTMPSRILAITSPSHPGPLSIHLGSHTPDDSETFEPKKAVASLSSPSTHLLKDFILLIKCSSISTPRALLSIHPTIPNSKALMVTLVPKFTFPPSSAPKPEIVFIADRSGSMERRIPALRSSLGLFLKSLPTGIKFNICSFGSSHSFLWDKSQPYTAETLKQAQRHVEAMQADYGGTEILPAIRSTVAQRYTDIPLEMMVLTDGEVWHPEELYEYIEQAAEKGDVRVFSLGIGRDVSHALVEGIARLGRGFAQVVGDEREMVGRKVVRMLKAGLSPHVNDYRLEWEGKPQEAEDEIGTWETITNALKKISLFDIKADMDGPVSFADIPEFRVPGVLQAPYKIPSLFPFSRTTVYAILAADVPAPSSVWLRGTAPSGEILELEISVQVVEEKGATSTIHQLAARKMLQELEEGSGYIHSGKFGVDKKKNPGTFDEWVKREGVRLGVGYGLASKWTSFVAVDEEGETVYEDMAPTGTALMAFQTGDGSRDRFRCLSSVKRKTASVTAPDTRAYDSGIRYRYSSQIEPQPQPEPSSSHNLTMALISEQTYEGYFLFTPTLATHLGVPFERLQDLLPTGSGLGEEHEKRLWATVLAIEMFERRLGSEREMWELVVDKAKEWIRMGGVQLDGLGVDVRKAESVASQVVDGLPAV